MQTAIEKILNYWAASIYMQPLVILAASVCLCAVTFTKFDFQYKRQLELYFSSLLVLFVGTNIILGFQLVTGVRLNLLVENANNLFNLIEAYVFLQLLQEFTGAPHRKSQMKLLFGLHVLLTIIGVVVLMKSGGTADTFRWNTFSTVIHFYIIIVPCIWHFFDTYKKNLPLFLKQTSVVLAISAYALISIPVFAVIEQAYILQFGDKITAIHYVFLSALCVIFCRSNILDVRESMLEQKKSNIHHQSKVTISNRISLTRES